MEGDPRVAGPNDSPDADSRGISVVIPCLNEETSIGRAVDQAFELSQAVLPPVVLTELLSSPAASAEIVSLIGSMPVLELLPGYWERAAATRSAILSRRLRARLADTLVTQSCLDHDVALITRDRDFRHFASYSGLELI